MSLPQTEAYLARTSTEPGGHCSMRGLGEGRISSWLGAKSRAAQQEQSSGLPIADASSDASVSVPKNPRRWKFTLPIHRPEVSRG